MRGDRPGLLRDLEFLKFWGGQSISLLGTQFTLLALPIAAAVTLRATPADMGVLTAAQFAPGLLISLAAGVWLDRARRRPVLVGTQLVSAVVLATVPLAAVVHVLSMPQLFAVAFLAGSANAVFAVALSSFLPTLVGRGRLVEANARYQTSLTVASLVGPGLAGATVQLLTAPIAIAVDAASFLAGAATSLSSLVGSVLIRPLQRRVGLGRVMVLAPIVLGLGCSSAPAAPSPIPRRPSRCSSRAD